MTNLFQETKVNLEVKKMRGVRRVEMNERGAFSPNYDKHSLTTSHQGAQGEELHEQSPPVK